MDPVGASGTLREAPALAPHDAASLTFADSVSVSELNLWRVSSKKGENVREMFWRLHPRYGLRATKIPTHGGRSFFRTITKRPKEAGQEKRALSGADNDLNYTVRARDDGLGCCKSLSGFGTSSSRHPVNFFFTKSSHHQTDRVPVRRRPSQAGNFPPMGTSASVRPCLA